MINKIATLVAIICLASGAYALPRQDLTIGAAVDRIDAADQIAQWHTIDPQRLVLQLNTDQRYLLTLSHQCHRLRRAQHIGVSMSNNTIWAGFDYVTTDGWQCPIERINTLL